MSDRPAENEQRSVREKQELAAAQRARRGRRRRLAGAGVVALVAVVAITAVVATQNADNDLAPTESEAPFGPHYAGLEARRVAAGVSTMSSPTASVHTHPQLTIWGNGDPIRVPQNVGIDPSRPPSDMAGLHTHAPDGIIHNEGQANATLGQFFAICGVPFNHRRLGPWRTGSGHVVQMWVDGKPSRAFGRLALRDAQRIVVSFGPPSATPPTT